MTKTIVYYHPKAIVSDSNRGSEVRVSSMLSAFQQLDYDVRVIAGLSKDRHRQIRKLKSDIAAGLRVEFAYGESTNAPIMLADKTLLPSMFYKDYAFFSWLQKRAIPFGIFYRDLHWAFDFLDQQLPWPLSRLLKPFYYLDWYIYDKYSSVFFLPSQSMNRYLPRERAESTFNALPPGFDSSLKPRAPYDPNSDYPLQLLYVGGIEPTVYDISKFLKIICQRSDVRLILCCRRAEWAKYRHRYEMYMGDNVSLVHANKDELFEYYQQADLSIMMMAGSEYMDFAVPVKLFESIGYCVPIISLGHKEVAEYIKAGDIGWVINEPGEFDSLISQLAKNRGLLSEKYSNLLAHRDRHSWKIRASCAADRLLQT